MHIRSIAAALALLAVIQPSPLRIDLTGKPAATIGDAFTKVAGVREVPDGRAIVTDAMERSVFLVDFGRRSRVPIGRQGDGPGEYHYPSAPFAAPAGATWVYDANGRTLVISPEGKVTNTLPMSDMGQPGGVSRTRGTDRVGRLYFEGNQFNPETGRFTDTVAIVRWNPAASRADVVGRVSNGGRVRKMKDGQAIASMARDITPFPHMDAWVVLPDGRVAVVRHDPYQIDIIDGGKTTPGQPMTYEPIKITPAEIAAFQSRTTTPRVGSMRIDGGTGPMAPGVQFEASDFPPMMPPFIAASVLSTPDGEIWVGRSHAAAEKLWIYDIFGDHGRLLGQATLKPNSTVVGFGVKSVYVARVNPDDDLVYLEKYARR